MASVVAAVLKKFEDYQGTAVNSALIIGTGAIEAIVNVVVYSCPCVETIAIKKCKTFVNGSMVGDCVPTSTNYYYGLSYLIGPALPLFFIGVTASSKLWKLWTGCVTKKYKRSCGFSCGIMSKVFARCLIAPIAWICFGLLDGRYYACAVTAFPYELHPDTDYTTCLDVVSEIGKIICILKFLC